MSFSIPNTRPVRISVRRQRSRVRRSDTLAARCGAAPTCSTSIRRSSSTSSSAGARRRRSASATRATSTSAGRSSGSRSASATARGEKIFSAVIDDVEVKKVSELSRRDIEHDNPEFRRARGGGQLPRADLQPAGLRRGPGHRDPLLADRRAAGIAFRQRRDAQPQLGHRWPTTAFSPPGCSSPRASRSSRRSTTRRAGRVVAGGGGGRGGPRRGRAAASARSRAWSGGACCPTGSSSR